MRRLPGKLATLGALALLGTGCLDVDLFAIPDAPDASVDDAGTDAGEWPDENLYQEGKIAWVNGSLDQATVGSEYRPVPPGEAYAEWEGFSGDVGNYNQSQYLPWVHCLEGTLALERLDLRYPGGLAEGLTDEFLLDRLGVLNDTGLELYPEYMVFSDTFAERFDDNLPATLVGFDGPDGIDKAILTFAADPAPVPTDNLCVDGYAAKVVIGARYVFAFRFRFDSDEGRSLFIDRRGWNPIEALDTDDFEALYRDTVDAGLTEILVGALQIGGMNRAGDITHSGCAAGNPVALQHCADLVKALREAGDQFMAVLAENPSAGELGGHVPTRIERAYRTW
jgi:hypothetical protein